METAIPDVQKPHWDAKFSEKASINFLPDSLLLKVCDVKISEFARVSRGKQQAGTDSNFPDCFNKTFGRIECLVQWIFFWYFAIDMFGTFFGTKLYFHMTLPCQRANQKNQRKNFQSEALQDPQEPSSHPLLTSKLPWVSRSQSCETLFQKFRFGRKYFF